MAAAGGEGGPMEGPPAPAPVHYHMSDDEEDKAFYAKPDEPQSPSYGRRATFFPDAAGEEDDGDDDMADAAGYSPEEEEEAADMVDAAGYSSGEEAAAALAAARVNFEYEDDPPDPVGLQRQRDRYAGYALQHYNADPSNAVKYDLVEATHGKYILVGWAHVNFVARPRGGGGGERLFFAELHQQLGRDTMVPTCLRSLDSEDDRVGGLADKRWVDYDGEEAHYCFACNDDIKHPKDGTCYTAGR